MKGLGTDISATIKQSMVNKSSLFALYYVFWGFFSRLFEKTRKRANEIGKDVIYIDNRFFYLAWNNNHCCHLKSVGRKSKPKVGFKTF